MGASSSKGSMLTGGAGPQTVQLGTCHSPIPEDVVPYQGVAIEYRIVLINSKLKQKMTFGFAQGTPLTVSDIDSYFGILQQQYSEYFTVSTFFRVPHSVSSSGFSSVTREFQGIFFRPASYAPSQGQWQLKVEQSCVQLSLLGHGSLFSMFSNTMDANLGDIYSKINQNAQMGGKFLCMECSGNNYSAGMSMGQSPIYGVDLFFDMPQHPNPVHYTYIGFSTPMYVKYDFGGIQIQCDFPNTLAMHLDQGWKLVDIFIATQETGVGNHGSKQNYRPNVINTIWFFEKETQRWADNTPRYQVTMVEYYMKVKTGFGSIKADLQLAPLLTEMGKRGWSLVCVLDTPQMQTAGFATAKSGLILFFQRPLIATGPSVGYQPPPPPPYPQ